MTAPRIGFRFVPMPVEIWDGSHNDLTVAEFRLYGYLIRHQVCLGRPIGSITHEELVNGRWAFTGGVRKRADSGCGLARNAIKRALASLTERGWIETHDVSDNPNVPRFAVQVLIADEVFTMNNGLSTMNNGLSTVDNDLSTTDRPSNTLEVLREKNPLESPKGGIPKTARDLVYESVISQKIFPYYIAKIRPESKDVYTLTPKRLEQGIKRYRECMNKHQGGNGSAAELAEALMKIAIDTMAASDFHMGRHAKSEGHKYNDWENLFRSAEMLEKWLVRSDEEDTHAQNRAY